MRHGILRINPTTKDIEIIDGDGNTIPLTSNGSLGAGSSLVGATNSTLNITSNEDDDGSAIGILINTTNDIVTNGAKVLSVTNNTVEMFSLGFGTDFAGDSSEIINFLGYNFGSPLIQMADNGGSPFIYAAENTDLRIYANSDYAEGAGFKRGGILLNISGSPEVQFEAIEDGVGSANILARAAMGFEIQHADDPLTELALLRINYDDATFGDLANTKFLFSSAGDSFGISTDVGLWGYNNDTTPTSMRFFSRAADGATSIGYLLNTENALANAASKLLSLQNNDVEKVYIDKDGNIEAGQILGFKTDVQSTATSANSNGSTIILVTDTSSAWTVTLDSDDAVEGKVIVVKDASGLAGTNNITIDTEGAELIDGAGSTSIATNYGTVRLMSDGTNWFTI